MRTMPIVGCARRLLAVALFAGLSLPVLAGIVAASPASASDAASMPAWPLHTRGRFIVDRAERRFKLVAVNWYGASDVLLVPGGLDKAPLSDIVQTIRSLGFNSVRLPFSNVMLHAARVPDGAVAANPQLFGKTPLEVYDAVIAELTAQGLAVIINNHTTHPMWCCSYDDDGLWYTQDYSEDQWVDDWAAIVARYRQNPGVVGADLRNEVRIAKLNGTILPNPPSWGKGPNDWRAAAERAGNRVLQVNPDILVVVEGINFPRDHLRGVYLDPIRLDVPDRLVYSAHNYGYIGPQLTGKKYGEMDYASFQDLMGQEWGFVTAESQAYTAPVWVSEFGDAMDQAPDKQQWFANITRYLADNDFDFAYWALNPGPKPSGEGESFALLAADWRTPLNDWRLPYLANIQKVRRGPGVEPDFASNPVHHFEAQIFSDWDTNRAQNAQDWFGGSFKATCRETARIVGLSVGQRERRTFAHEALCSDFGGSLGAGERSVLYNQDNDAGAVGSHTQGGDWSNGANKVECAPGSYMAGIAQQQGTFAYRVTGILCVQAQVPLSSNCHTETFGDGDGRATDIPGDWDPHQFKGQCGLSDYVAGLSLRSGHAYALLCCQR